MNIKEAWNTAIHGGAIIRPNGSRVEKWIGDKPGLQPSFERFIEGNVSNLSTDDLVAGDWTVE